MDLILNALGLLTDEEQDSFERDYSQWVERAEKKPKGE
jgi:hypothetical protein